MQRMRVACISNREKSLLLFLKIMNGCWILLNHFSASIKVIIGFLFFVLWKWKMKVKSVVSDSLQPHGLEPTRLLCPWSFPGKSTGVGCHFLLQGIFPTQGLNPGLPHCRQTLYHLSHKGRLGDQPRQHIKKQRHYLTDKGPHSQSYGFSCSHV